MKNLKKKRILNFNIFFFKKAPKNHCFWLFSSKHVLEKIKYKFLGGIRQAGFPRWRLKQHQASFFQRNRFVHRVNKRRLRRLVSWNFNCSFQQRRNWISWRAFRRCFQRRSNWIYSDVGGFYQQSARKVFKLNHRSGIANLLSWASWAPARLSFFEKALSSAPLSSTQLSSTQLILSFVKFFFGFAPSSAQLTKIFPQLSSAKIFFFKIWNSAPIQFSLTHIFF